MNLQDPQVVQAVKGAIKAAIDSLMLEIRNDVTLTLRRKENPGPPFLNTSKPNEPPATRNFSSGLAGSVAANLATIKGNRISGRVGVNKEYGAPLEFGAPANGLEPRPFMRPTIEDNRERYTTIAAEDVARGLRKVFG